MDDFIFYLLITAGIGVYSIIGTFTFGFFHNPKTKTDDFMLGVFWPITLILLLAALLGYDVFVLLKWTRLNKASRIFHWAFDAGEKFREWSIRHF